MKTWYSLLLLLVLTACSPEKKANNFDVFGDENLVAWCIVPFDKSERSPEERAQMLQRLGLTKLAYDWREKHVPEFEDEILACQKYGIEFFAFWGEHSEAFALFEKYDLRPQIWKTLPSPKTDTQEERIRLAATAMLPLVEKTRELGCKFGLYNHGGWGGEPENLVAVVEWLRSQTDAAHVGIVYNMHHGHDHIEGFAGYLQQMLPYLHCLNLNGMHSTADPKIVSLGNGDHEERLMKIILESGYAGPIGILDHRNEMDAEISLRENLDGLTAIRARLTGN